MGGACGKDAVMEAELSEAKTALMSKDRSIGEKERAIKTLQSDAVKIQRDIEDAAEKAKQLRLKLRAASEKQLKRFMRKMLMQAAKGPIMNWRDGVQALRNQQAAERKMRRVAGKIMQRDAISAVDEWKRNLGEQKAEDARREEEMRIERFKKRVMGRMTKRSCVEVRNATNPPQPSPLR